MDENDFDFLLRTYLVSLAPIGQVESQRLFASSEVPEGYRPDSGPAIAFAPRGGPEQDEADASAVVSYQFRVVGLKEEVCRNNEIALYDVLHNAQSYRIMASRREQPAQLVVNEAGWREAVTFYSIMFRRV